MNLKKVGWEVTDWIYLDRDGNKWWAIVVTTLNFRVS